MDLSDLHIFKTVAEEGRHRSRGDQAAPRAVEHLHPGQATRAIGGGAAFRAREAAPVPVAERGAPAGLCRQAAAPCRPRRSARCPRRRRAAVAVGALESTAASRLPRVLAAYHKAYPDVRVELMTGTNDALTAAVLDRRVEAAFAAEVPSSKDLVAERLFRERLVITFVARPLADSPPAGRRWRLGDRVPEWLRLPACVAALAGQRPCGLGARARIELVPRHRCVCRLGHRHRAGARVGARHRSACRGGAPRVAQGACRRDHAADPGARPINRPHCWRCAKWSPRLRGPRRTGDRAAPPVPQHSSINAALSFSSSGHRLAHDRVRPSSPPRGQPP